MPDCLKRAGVVGAVEPVHLSTCLGKETAGPTLQSYTRTGPKLLGGGSHKNKCSTNAPSKMVPITAAALMN